MKAIVIGMSPSVGNVPASVRMRLVSENLRDKSRLLKMVAIGITHFDNKRANSVTLLVWAPQ